MRALLLAPMGSVHRRFNRACVDALRALGHEVHLLADFSDGDGPEGRNSAFAAGCRAGGIVVHSVGFERRSLLGNLRAVAETRAVLARESFDLVHAHTETGGLVLRLAGRPSPRTRLVYTPHGMSFYRGGPRLAGLAYRPVERWICAGMDANVALNAEELGVLRGWDPSTAFLVHGVGLDVARFRAPGRPRSEVRAGLGVPDAARLVLSVGELDGNKNHRTVVEALARLGRGDVHYAVCGVGPLAGALAARADALGLSGRVHLPGYRGDVPDLLHAADAFAFPSFHEGLPVSVLEAMAAGLPVVCSSVRGCVDLVRDGVNGFLVRPDDVGGWADRLGRLLDDDGLRLRFAERSGLVVGEYDGERVRAELESMYRKIRE